MLLALNRRRNQQVIELLSNFADPDSKQQILKQYRAILFPEQRHADLKKIGDGRKLFDKLRGFKFEMRKA